MTLTWIPNGIRTSVVVLSEADGSPPAGGAPPPIGLTSTYNGFGVIPASESPAGFAITNNYYGAGEVDFWNLVNNDDPNGQGWYFYQKTGATTAKVHTALYSGPLYAELSVYSPTEAIGASLGASEIEAWVGTFHNNNFVLFTNNENRVVITGNGTTRFITDGLGIIPASEATAGFAITNNYGGSGEVNFWNLVNNDDLTNQGFYFKQKTGAATEKTLAIINSSPTGRTVFDIYGPDDNVIELTVTANSVELYQGGANGYSFSGGPFTIDGSLLQNKAVATPATGATVTMAANQRYQAIAPAGTIAALTLVLPPSPVDSQVMSAGSSQVVTALTVNAGTGGAARVGAPTTLAAGSGFTMVYQSSNNTWYRAG